MQQVLVAIALFFTTVLFGQQTTSVNENISVIEVSVNNVTSDEGMVYFALYTAEGFLTKPLKTASDTIKDGVSKVKFENVSAGHYAIVCFHDANSNERMDFDLNGMPKESFGTSNNTFNPGPPVFEDSRFEFQNGTLALEIKF